MKRIRSLLCVPAHRPALYEKALRTNADCLMFDLEDSTPAQHKDYARATLQDYLAISRGGLGKIVTVRVNAGNRDEARTFAPFCDALVPPKVERAADLWFAFDAFEGKPLLPVIETTQAIVNLREILSFPGVAGGIFGIADYAASLGVSDRIIGHRYAANPYLVMQRFQYAKQKLATYAAAFGKQALDTCFVVKGPQAAEFIEDAWIIARSMGFTGAACIHPGQVELANAHFGPSRREEMWAHTTHAEHTARHGEVGVDEYGQVVGMPVDRQAQSIIRKGNA